LIYIESKENKLFKAIKKLKEKRYRIKEEKFILEGFRLVEEGIKANINIEHIIITENNIEKLKESSLLKNINEDKIVIISENLFLNLSSTENPQGILAIVKNKVVRENLDGDFYVVCDKVQDPGNLGTIIRTAHAAGVNGIILTKGTTDIYNDKTIRSTMGSIFYVPIYYDNEQFALIKKLKEEGVSLVATSLNESKNFFSENLKGKVMIAVGNEGNGISDELFSLSDKKVKIPMPGGAESLNVAIATSILLFEKVRQNVL
jgi:RNA methyltransferase, TrmH family